MPAGDRGRSQGPGGNKYTASEWRKGRSRSSIPRTGVLSRGARERPLPEAPGKGDPPPPESVVSKSLVCLRARPTVGGVGGLPTGTPVPWLSTTSEWAGRSPLGVCHARLLSGLENDSRGFDLEGTSSLVIIGLAHLLMSLSEGVESSKTGLSFRVLCPAVFCTHSQRIEVLAVA